MSVDLPEPDEPMMATNSPRSTTMLTPAKCVHLDVADEKVRVTFSTLMTGSGIARYAAPLATRTRAVEVVARLRRRLPALRR